MAEKEPASTAPRKTANAKVKTTKAKAAAPPRKTGLEELKSIMGDLGWPYHVLKHRLISRGYVLEVVQKGNTKTDLMEINALSDAEAPTTAPTCGEARVSQTGTAQRAPLKRSLAASKRHETTPVENEKPVKKTKKPDAKQLNRDNECSIKPPGDDTKPSKKNSNEGVIPYPPIEPSVRNNCPYEEAGISCDRRTCRAWHKDQFKFMDSKRYCAEGYNWRRKVDLPVANMHEVEAKPAKTKRDQKNQALFNKYFDKNSNVNRPRHPGLQFKG